MKGSSFHRSKASVLGSLVLLSSALVHADTANFTVHIQNRGGLPPTARVKITLQTGMAVAGFTVTVEGQSTTVPGIINLANGDKVSVAALTGNANSVGILYQPFSQLNGNDWCNYLSGKNGEQTISMSFVGPTVTGHRITSYATAGSTNIQAVDCGQAPRRVENSKAQFTVAPPGTDLGREPQDIILVLDESGSMSDPPPLDADQTTSMWKVLTDAVGSFIGAWELVDPDSNHKHDRVGLMFYSTTTDPANFNGSIFLPRGTAPPGNTHNWKQIIDAVGQRGPTSSTAMGLGLKTALADWQADKQNDPTAVLMTDGIQNTGPSCIDPQGQSGCFVSDGGNNWKFDGDADPMFRLGIPVSTIAMGTPDQVPFAILDGVALETTGIHLQTATSATAGTTFGDTLVNILKGSTMSLAFRTSGTITSSTAATPVSQVLLDGSVKRAILVLQWQGGRNVNALDLRISPPGTCPPCNGVAPVQRVDGQLWTAQAVDIPSSGPIGEWAVQVIRKKPLGEVVAALAAPYQLSVYSVEGRLEYRLNFPAAAVGTGDSMVLQAEISYDGKPLKGLGEGVHVHIERPNTGMGTILHNTDVPNDVLSTEVFANDHTTPYDRKVRFLTKTANLASSVEPAPVPTDYILRDDGNSAHGDATKDDGVYSVKIADTSRPGLYRFNVTMDWDNSTTGKIHRIETLERQFKVNPDADHSVVKVAQTTTPGDWVINVDPVDKFGNYLGPGYLAKFEVQVSGGGTVVLPPADDRQSGSYAIKLTGVPAGADPTVSIKVDGHELRNDKLSSIGKRKDCFSHLGSGAVLVLIPGMALLGLLIYVPRRRRVRRQR